MVTVSQVVELVRREAEMHETVLKGAIASNDFMEALEADTAARTLRALAVVMEVELPCSGQ